MAVEDRWHYADEAAARRAGVTEQCACKGRVYPTKDHGRGKRWRSRVRGAKTMSFDKKSDAEVHDTAVKADLLKGVTPFDHTAGRVTFRDYSAKWLREKHYTGDARQTVASRVNTHLLPTFGDMRMCDIRHSTVKSWLAELRTAPSKHTKRPLAPTTIARVYDALAGILSSAVRDKVLAVSPLEGIEYPNPPKGRRVLVVWEQSTVNKLLGKVPDRDHAIPLLAATCGLRQGEAFAVAVGDINFFRKDITVRHQVQRTGGKLALVAPKGGKVRTVPMPEVTSAALAAHIKRYGTVTVRCECCGTDNEVLFTVHGRLLADPVWNAQVWHPAVTAAKLTRSRSTGLHQLRHFFASVLIDGGASMYQVQEYMGHSSIQITAGIYGHLFERSHDRARSIVDAAFTLDSAQPLASSGDAGVYPLRTAEID